MALTKTIANMKELKRALDASFLPKLSALSWTGASVSKLYKAHDGLEIWTVLFGWPKGVGPTGCMSIDVGAAPAFPRLDRRDALKRLCNGWDENSLVYHVPSCWHRRFPEEPIEYSGRTASQLAEALLPVFDRIDRWARTCCLAQLAPLADELTRSEFAHSRSRGKDWQKLLAVAGIDPLPVTLNGAEP
jgi:hypothetical protein